MLDAGNLKRYVIYAVGEIFLVMVGILLALQVNTWNENRKLTREETLVLNNFSQSLHSDLVNLHARAKFNEMSDNSIRILLDHLENNKPYHDSLKHHFGFTNITAELHLNLSIYESLKSNNLNLISNDIIRNNITNLYNYFLYEVQPSNNRFSDIIQDASINLYDSRFQSFWKTNYPEWKDNKSLFVPEMNPINFESLGKDTTYLYFLRSLPNRRVFLVRNHLDDLERQIKEILLQIDQELNP